ncbi:MAG: aspartate 1-decarboxylase [Omnitrophica bacterium RIFCSPLOWO2_01_FULL_45_10]|nr:MAG: aspartate 1-decarboxylase [Omnitrophica bacterium RIFCSPLOWO2_01_FULL_45_10]
MLRMMCKSKIHRARITKVDLNYEGSIGIDSKLLEASRIYPNEMVQVVNVNNGARFETYVIEEKRNSGAIALYGAAAHMGKVGDIVIILSYVFMDEKKAKTSDLKTVYVNSKNREIHA